MFRTLSWGQLDLDHRATYLDLWYLFVFLFYRFPSQMCWYLFVVLLICVLHCQYISISDLQPGLLTELLTVTRSSNIVIYLYVLTVMPQLVILIALIFNLQ